MATTVPLNFLTPSTVAQCGRTVLQWSGGQAPYSVTAIGAQNTISTPTLGTVGSFRTLRAAYRVAIPGGTLIKFRVVDSSTPPQVADTNLISVADSAVDSCLPASQQTRTRSSTAASTPATPPASTRTSAPSVSSTGDSITTRSTRSRSVAASRSLSGGVGTLGSSSVSGDTSATDDATLGSSTNLANSERRHTSISPAFFGGAAGAAILLILVIAGWCMWHKRRQRHTKPAEEDWFAVPNAHHILHQPDIKAQDDIAMHTIGSHQQRWTGAPHASTEQLMGSRAVSTYSGHHSYVAPREHDFDHASLYAARAQEYYPSDAKRPINVLSADADTDHGEASVLPYAEPQQAGQSTAAHAQEEPPPVPTKLSPEEMARLADLVASRMRASPDPQEPPPSYQ